MNLRHQYGFTLWELLITLLVAGILIGIGVPNVMEFQRNSAMTTAANQLLTGLIMARTEAVKRQSPVGVCLSADPTAANPTCSPNAVADASTLGFIVWVDENNNFDANGARILTDGTDGNGVVDANELVLMREVPPGGTSRISTSSFASMTPLPSVASVKTRAPFGSKLSFSSTHTTKPSVVASATAFGEHVGIAAVGLALRHRPTGDCRLTASVRATMAPVSSWFAAVVIALLRWNSMTFGTPMPIRMPATSSVISSSQSVKPCWRGFMGPDYT